MTLPVFKKSRPLQALPSAASAPDWRHPLPQASVVERVPPPSCRPTETCHAAHHVWSCGRGGATAKQFQPGGSGWECSQRFPQGWEAHRWCLSVGSPGQRNRAAHTALAVKACLLGGNSNTKCSMTFVNIAVAISALAGGGGGHQKRFRTETRIRWCFRHFSRIFGCLSARGYWNGILGHFGSFPAMEKRPKMKKTLYIARFCRVFGCQSIENTAKTSVLDWRYSKKRVNYRMLDWKHYKNTVKSNVLEGFTAFMAKNV